MGVHIEGPTHMPGDNTSTIHNTQCPESQLKKKSNSICYHAVREAVAMGELLTVLKSKSGQDRQTDSRTEI